MILQAQHLTAGYKQPVLQDICFAVEKPQLIGLVGENGVGKSTLLKTLCGLIAPLSGAILLNGKNIQSLSVKQTSEQITYLPGTRTFHPQLTVKELLLLADSNSPFSFYNTPPLTEKQQNALKQLHIQHLLHHPLGKLSDGQYQLASVAFALCRNTPIILFDEPLAFLDFNNRKLLMRYFANLVAEWGKTILFSSHDLYVLQQCHQAWHIENRSSTTIPSSEIAGFVEHLLKEEY